VVGDDGESVFPAQLAQSLHLFGKTAEVDLAVDHAAAVEVLTQCATVGTAIGGKDENGVERHLATQTSQILNFEF
jgi:hypothetical protein